MARMRVRLTYPTELIQQPIVYHLVKDHNLVVNIFRAKVTPEEEGYLVLDVTGTEEDIAGAMEFVRTSIFRSSPAGALATHTAPSASASAVASPPRMGKRCSTLPVPGSMRST